MSYYYEKRSDGKNYYFANHKTCPSAALHFHSAREILIVRRGRMRAFINGKEYIIGAGEGCFVDKFYTHGFSDLESDTEIYVFVSNGDFFEDLVDEMNGIPPVKFDCSDFRMLDLFFDYYEKSNDERERYSFFKGAVSFLMAQIASKNNFCQPCKLGRERDICDILAYICDHFREDISLQSISAAFGYSPQYFSALFHKYMDVNLAEYINIARVNYANKIINSEKSIAEIAFESGFNSLNSFYRAYKKVFGCVPRA